MCACRRNLQFSDKFAFYIEHAVFLVVCNGIKRCLVCSSLSWPAVIVWVCYQAILHVHSAMLYSSIRVYQASNATRLMFEPDMAICLMQEGRSLPERRTVMLASQVSIAHSLHNDCASTLQMTQAGFKLRWPCWYSHAVSADAIVMEGKMVQIKLKGNVETARAPIQRNLFWRHEEDESSLFTPNGLPAGRLWLNELDDLVETNR